ncbi:SPK domain-containing protein [Caenorhabditis elegans]|uniref:SPK domain-containing protein n=1 Tax=Caenorhabditis elegans TaxID=6239 RepID=Q9XU05_CAEEL|nr:SPK domain-containing protein [Caenorhabditis elegans]CAB07288.1 SPK domain-containing protein [Caenorhabditis elegans]|eukprot:NP_499794.1 Uncharacterized protein CELE_T28A8.4 [Caenorhabditis elegans]
MDTPLGRLINFLVEQTKDAVEPLVASRIFNQFAELDGVGLSSTAYYSRFHEHIAPNIGKCNNFNVVTRIRMMFALSATVPDSFLALIRFTGTVQLDERKRINKYVSNDGRLNLEGYHRCMARSKNQWGKDPAEVTRLMNFLVEKAKDSIEPLVATAVFTDFGKSEESGLKAHTYAQKFYKQLAPEMDQLVNYSIQDRVRVMFGLAGEVTDNFLTLCRMEGVVELDEKNRICEYSSHDGTLALKGDHSHMARMRRSSEYQRKIRRISIWKFSGEKNCRSPKRARISQYDNDDMEYIGAVEGQPKAEPIDAPYNYNTDHLNEDPSISKNERVIPVESKIISLHDFLKQLTQFICILESLELEELKQQIKESISTDDDESLQIIDICAVLETFCFGISRKTRVAASNIPAMKVKDFLLAFKFFLLWMDSSELRELQQKVQGEIEEPEFAEKVLPISDIRQSLQNLLSTISQY